MAEDTATRPGATTTQDSEETTKQQRMIARVMDLRIVRAVLRYVSARGALLSGGITYSGLFSIFAALAIGWTAFMRLLGQNEELRDQVIDSINEALPGIIESDTESGLIRPDQLVLDTALNPASVIAVAVLLWTAVTVMSHLRLSIQAMFGVVTPPENFVINKLKALAGFGGLALAVLLTSAVSIAMNTFGQGFLDLIGIEGDGAVWSIRIASYLLTFLIDMSVFIMLMRVTASVRPLRRDLLIGAALGGVFAGILRIAGTSIVGSVDDPLLASFAAIVTLLLWLNIQARGTLIVAAFTANPPAPKKPDTRQEVHFDSRPNFVTRSAPWTMEWKYQPLTGTVAPDPDLHPEAIEAEAEHREHQQKLAEGPGGAIGSLKKRRVERLERRAEEARSHLNDSTETYLKRRERETQ